MNAEFTLSVVIPAYNATGFIGRALDSVLSQSVKAMEVIVVDDGSVDDLEAFIEEHYSSQVVYVRQSNAGAAKARNRGVESARGELIAFLDADDYWHPRKLEYQIAAFQEIEDLGLCYTGCYTTEELGDEQLDLSDTDDSSPILIEEFSDIFLDPYFGTPGVVLRRDYFHEVGGFDESFHRAEDVELWLRFSYNYRVAHIPAELFVVDVRDEGLSMSGGTAIYVDNLAIIDKFCSQHPEFVKSGKSVIRKARQDVHLQWGRYFLYRNENVEARRKFLHAFLMLPNHEAMYLWAKAVYGQLSRKWAT